MDNQDILLDTFISEGTKLGLNEVLLIQIFQELHKSQFVHAGHRDMIRARLLKIIKQEG